MSIVNIAIFCGIGAGPVLGGLFADAWGLASVFYMMATLCFLAFLLVAINMPACCPIDRQRHVGLLVNVKHRCTSGSSHRCPAACRSTGW